MEAIYSLYWIGSLIGFPSSPISSMKAGAAMLPVMIVDDEALVRSGIALIIDAAPDMTVVSACDGPSALDEAIRTEPAVVLLDIRMPEVDGLTILGLLRARPRPPAIAMLTTFGSDEHIARALRAGAAGFLLKDTLPAQLVDSVRILAAGGQVLSPAATKTVIEGYVGGQPAMEILDRLGAMTFREREVLALIGDGMTNAEISRRLYLSGSTVKDYVSSVLTKLGVANRVQAAVIAQRVGLVSGDH